MAFSQNTSPTFLKQPLVSRVVLVNANGTTPQTVYTSGASGSKIIGVVVTSDDTARDVQLSITNGGTAYILGTKTVAANSGTNASVPSVNLIDSTTIPGLPVDMDGNPFFYIKDTDTVTVGVTVAVTAAKKVTVHVFASDF